MGMQNHDGRLIKAAMAYSGMTQAQLAKKLKCDQSTISAMVSHTNSGVWYGYMGQAYEVLKLGDPKTDFSKALLRALMA